MKLSKVSLDQSALSAAGNICIDGKVFLGSVAQPVLQMSEDLLEAII